MTDVAASRARQIEEPSSTSLTWELVHAEPGALIYAVPGPPRRSPLGESSGGWLPSGTGETAGSPSPEEHPALHYAGYIGRVGVLAAALGVGAALAGSQGVAWAEPSDSDSSSSSSSTSDSTPPQRGSRRAPSARTTQPGPATTTAPALDMPALDVPVRLPSPITATRGRTPVAPRPTTALEVPVPEAPSSPTVSSPAIPEVPQQPVNEAPVNEAPQQPVNEAPPTRQPVTAPNDGPSPAVAPAAPDTPPAEIQLPRPIREIPLPATAATPIDAAPAPAADAAAGRPAPTPSTPSAPITRRASQPVPPAATSPTRADRIIGAVLEPLSTPNSPAARTVESTASWSLLAWVQRTFSNRKPSLAYNPTQSTQINDTVTGRLNPLDPDGDALTYTASTPVNGGAVSIAGDGTFTYTPTAAVAAAGGIDSFQVTASDEGNGFHLHGVRGLLNLITFGLVGDAGHSVTTTVTVDVNAAPVPAAPPYTLGSAEPATGGVPGQLHVTDADANTLSYNVTGGPANGSVILTGNGTFTYTPTATARHEASAEDAGPVTLNDTFTVTVDDTHGRSIDVPVTVSIDPTNAAPTITGVTVSDPDTDGTVTVSVTVTDPDDDPITYLVIHDPSYGTAAPTPGGFSFTPTAQARHDAAGTDGIDTDNFQIAASDLHHGVDTATATVIISPANVAPSGLTQSVNIPDPVTGLVTGTVTGTDADGDPLTYSGTATTAKGAVIVDPDGTFAYTPTATARHIAAADAATEADKSDTFAVTADDAHGGTADITVAVAVAGANVAPTSNVTTGVPDGAGKVSGSLNTTDTDGDTLTYTVTTAPGKGSVTVNPDGSFSYAPTTTARHNASADTAADVDKIDSFTVTVDDAHGAAVPVAVNVVVSPANTAPSGTIVPNSPDPTSGEVTGSTTFTDPDGDTLIFTGSATTPKGSVTVNTDGTFTYTPTDAARHDAAADAAGTEDKQDSFTLTVADGHGSVQDVPVTVAIGSANAAPTVDVVVPQPDPSTGQVTGVVTAGDTDGDALTFSGSATTAKGSVTVNPDGTFTYTPTDAARHAASADTATLEDRQDTFTVTVDDGHGAAIGAAVLVSVSPTNQAPTGVAIPGSPDPDSGDVTGSVSATDPEGDPLTYSGSTSTAKGSVIVNTDGTFTYTPTEGARHNAAADTAAPEDKQDSFTVTVDDAHGGHSPVTVDVAIGSANAAPTVVTSAGDPDPGTGKVTGGVIATDPDNDEITYTLLTGPTKGTVTVDGDGAFAYTPSAGARHTAAADDAAPEDKTDDFTVTVNDGHGSTTAVSVSVAVSPANQIPTATPSFGTPDGGGTVTGSLAAVDTDGDTMTYTLTSTPASGTVTINPDGSFAYNPTDAAQLKAGLSAGSDADSFIVTINDGHGGVVPITVDTMTVAPAHTTRVGFIGGLGYKVWPVQFNPVLNRAYFGNYSDYPWNGSPSQVNVVDTTTNTRIGSVSLPKGPAVALAVSPDGTRVYAPNLWSNYLTVIDTGTSAIVATIPVGTAPEGVAVSPDGQRVYVTNGGSSTVSVIDTTTNTVIGTVPVTGGLSPYCVAVSPDGSRVYTANSQSNNVSVIDTTTNTVIATVPVGSAPHSLAITPDGSRIYAPNPGANNGNTVSVIDTSTNTVVATVTVGTAPYAVAISPDGSIAYVTNAASRTMSLIDTQTNTVISTIPLGASDTNYGVAVSPDGTKIYATNAYSSNATVISIVQG